ncbi:hypothetical protein [Catenulispora subtropica]|uniref:Uncharacterized protein n=1 Tax=Catenulispora subtropica TaxID=450798 RepID=A0ABP5DU01_9ACTN
MSRLDKRFLSIYLNDHLAGATAGSALARRMARCAGDPTERDRLEKVCREIVQDGRSLRDIMRRLGVRVDPIKVALAFAAERVGRLKPNGRVRSRSPLSDLIEVEAMSVAVSGKLAGWTLLREIAPSEDRLDIRDLERLIGRAEGQLVVLERIRLRIGAAVLGAVSNHRSR